MRQIKKRREVALISMLVVGLSLVGAGRASASLIFDQNVDIKGSGIGAVDTILSIQGKDKDAESGSVSWDGTKDVLGGFDEKPGKNSTQTILAVGSALDLRVIFNPGEPGGDNINLDNLILTLFSDAGSNLFSSGVFTPKAFPDSGQGTGKSGFAFKLDSTQAVSLSLALSTAGAGARYGLFAAASDAQGDQETFFLTQTELTQTPLPAALPLFASGLGLMGWFARSKKRKAAV